MMTWTLVFFMFGQPITVPGYKTLEACYEDKTLLEKKLKLEENKVDWAVVCLGPVYTPK